MVQSNVMFGDNLKKYRNEKGYSQKELADKLFVTRQCVSKWEKNATEPDLQSLVKMSELFGVPVDALVKDCCASSGDKKKKPDGDKKKEPDVNKFLFSINILVAIFCALLFVALWRYLPERIPAHFTHGEIDRYGSRAEIFINLITVAVYAALSFVAFLIFKRAGTSSKKRAAPVKNLKTAVRVGHIVITVCQAANLITIVAIYAKQITAVIPFATCACAALILCASIAMHPKITARNGVIGIRTADTLASDALWKKTNALGSYLFSALSAAIFCVNVAVAIKLSPLFFAAYVIPAAVVIIYAKVRAKNTGDE